MKNYFLVLEEGSLQKAFFRLKGSTTIGRSPESTISIPDPSVSRTHALLSLREGLWTLKDLGSANGIIFDGNRVDEVVLSFGDTFKIGNITFRFIEKESLEERNQLFETMEVLSSSLSASVADLVIPEDGDTAESWWERLEHSISTMPLFEHLEEVERERLADSGALYLFNANETVIQEGDTGRTIYVILVGKVKVVTKDHDNKELELAVLGPGQFFGEMAFLTGEPRSSSVIAIDSSVLIELSYATMREVMQKHPPVEVMLSSYYQSRQADSKKRRALSRTE